MSTVCGRPQGGVGGGSGGAGRGGGGGDGGGGGQKRDSFVDVINGWPLLAQIFNKSMQMGDVPQEWRDALIVPLFKKGNRSDPGNYRPVSLTSVVCKARGHPFMTSTKKSRF